MKLTKDRIDEIYETTYFNPERPCKNPAHYPRNEEIGELIERLRVAEQSPDKVYDELRKQIYELSTGLERYKKIINNAKDCLTWGG